MQAAIEKALLPVEGARKLFSAFSHRSGRLVFEVELSPKASASMVKWLIAQQKYLAESRAR
jgi:hypothetical protein